MPQLNAAAPEVWAELSPAEAAARDLQEGDLARISTARGSLRARVRITDIRDGLVFVPFHYGYWDTPGGHGPASPAEGRAANETTITDWDPASKPPLFKTAAARVERVARGDGTPAPAPTNTASAPSAPDGVPATEGGPRAYATEERP